MAENEKQASKKKENGEGEMAREGARGRAREQQNFFIIIIIAHIARWGC